MLLHFPLFHHILLQFPLALGVRSKGGSSVIAPSHFAVEAAGALRRLERAGEVSRDRARFALVRLTQLVTPAAVDELIVDAWALRDNLTVADAAYIVLARRSGAALMSTDERMLRAPGLDDIPFLRP